MDFFKICRCCGNLFASNSGQTMILFPLNFLETNRMLENILVEMISWKVKISGTDGLPQYICKICYSKFVDYFNFRENCISVQNQLLYKQNAIIIEKNSLSTIEIKCVDIKNEPTPDKANESDILETIPNEKSNEEAHIKRRCKITGTNENGKPFKNIEFVEMPDIDEQCCSAKTITSAIDLPDNTCDEKLVSDALVDYNEEIDFDEDYLEESNNSLEEKITYKKLKSNSLFCKYCCFDRELLSPSDVIFSTKAALIEHIETQHDPLSPYTCPVCKKQHKTIKQCRHHILYHHKKLKAICQVCGIECDYTNIKKHLKRHHTRSDFKCTTCGKKFLNISVARFEYHQRWHKSKFQKKCKYCGKIFIQGVHLRVHMMKHTGDYNIRCEICDKGFRSQYEKACHMHNAHDAEKPVKCLYCTERFMTYSKRVEHMINSHDYIQDTINEQLKCLKCNKVFRRETGFRSHIAKGCLGVGANNVKQKSAYKYKSVKHISCQYCSELFGKESALLKHIDLHSEEGRPFKCDICHLNYKTRSHLDLHKSIKHSSATPFACDICGKGFKVNFNLNSHKKHAHR